jgi:hypothetical protein
MPNADRIPRWRAGNVRPTTIGDAGGGAGVEHVHPTHEPAVILHRTPIADR